MPRARTSSQPTLGPESDGTAQEPEVTEAEWELRRRALLARIPPKDDRPKGLYPKLIQISSILGEVPKRGTNDFHHYKYVREADLVEAIRPVLAEYGIWLEWTLLWDPALGIVGHERRSQGVKNKDKEIIGEQETLTVLTAAFWFVDESGEKSDRRIVVQYGDDPGDKGAAKAMTSLIKYFLMKTFLVATGDDPEADRNTDQRAEYRGSTNRVNVQRSGRQGAAPGGYQQEGSAPQERKLSDLLKDAGATSAAAAIGLIEGLMGVTIPAGESPAASLTAFLNGLDPQVKGKLIYDLRKRIEAGSVIPAQPTDEQVARAASSEEGAAAVAQELSGQEKDESSVEAEAAI